MAWRKLNNTGGARITDLIDPQPKTLQCATLTHVYQAKLQDYYCI
jgi:hypothetical protein